MGNDTLQNLTTPWCISNLKIEVEPNVINYKNIGDNTEKITQNITMGFNLIKDEITGGTFTYSTMDSEVATVDENGVVTATGIGNTFIKVYNKENNIWGAVKVNVNGAQGQVQPKVVGGYNHFIALKADRTVWTWGYNGYGQLGTGDNVNKVEPVQVKAVNDNNEQEEITDAIDIAGGYYYTLILREDGTVWASGQNNYGQLGNGTTVNSNLFYKVKLDDNGSYLENIISIASEAYTAHALSADGSVYSWGLNDYGQLGVNNKTNSSYPVKMQKVSNIIQITAGGSHVSMLDADGSVWNVGNNGSGQFGINNTTSTLLPIQTQDTDGSILYGVKEIASGRSHNVILKEDGSVWTVGNASGGAIGDGTGTNKKVIVPVQKQVTKQGEEGEDILVAESVTDAKHIYAAGDTTYISRQKDGEENNQGMYVMGWNNYGQLFTGATGNKVYATEVQTDKDILTASATRNRFYQFPSEYSNQTGVIADQEGNVYTAGYNSHGEIGDGTTAATTTPVCISNLLLKVTPNVINYKEVGDTGEKITHTVSAGFNLLYNTVAQGNCKYTSLDESIATVSEDGIVTATGLGTTYIRVFNEEHGIWTSVKVNVNGEQGKTRAKVVGGWNHFVALKANGEVWTWGYNNYGQLGLGNTISATTPTKTKLYDSEDTTQDVYVTDVAAGSYHTLVLKSDGTVWSAGYNAYGQLGNGNTANLTEFVQVQGIPGKVIAISANNSTSYALTEDGIVYGWGYNKYGQLGNNSTTNSTVPVKVQRVSGVMKMSAGENYLTILASDGTVWSTGYNANGQLGLGDKTNRTVPTQMKNTDGTGVLTGIVDISSGSIHTLLLSEEATAYAVGYNGYGQLGNGNTATQLLPVQMVDSEGTAVTNIKAVEANGYSSIVAVNQTTNEKNSETKAGIYVAGYNNYGQLFIGNNKNTNVLTRVQEDKNVITQASTKNISYQTSAIVDDLGIVYTVGYNGHGEMGDGTTTSTLDPTSISNESIVVNKRRVILNLENNTTDKIDANTNLGFNLLFDNVDGEIVKYKSQDESIATIDNNGNIVAKSYGKTKIEVTTSSITEKVLIDVEVLRKDDIATPKVVRGQEFSVSLKADGTVWTWGYNGYGQLGLKDTVTRYKPTQISIENVIDIAAGANHVLLLTKDGKVYTFGQNSYSQLGRSGDTTKPEEVEGLENITKIAAGGYHSMALANDGSVYTWGYNGNGQLGNGTTTSSSTPIKIKARNIYQIDAGNQTSAAVDGNGNTYIWGYNGYGQLGNGTTTNLYAPRQVTSLDDIVEVAVENNTVLVLNAAGNVFASGYNGYGNLGNNTTKNSNQFVQVIEKIETSTIDGDDTQETVETPIYLSNVKSIEAGGNYAIAVKEDGTAVSWGQNNSSQMATGDVANKLLPVELTYGKDLDKIDKILDVAAGEASTTIVREDGKVWTVGKNNYGQLGDTSATNKTDFVCISKPTVMIENVPIRISGIGKTEQIKSNVSQGFNLLYNTVDDTDISYEIKDENIATVDNQTGKITSVKKGKTQVTVKDDISGESTTADVYVLDENDLTFPQIESSNYATLTLRANGEVWGYGYNGYGQLGTGDKTNKTVPTYTGINNIVQIALGYYHAIAVDKDGYVWTWGTNNYGQLGIGTTGGSSLEKVQVKSPDGEGVLENIIAVAAGNSYSVALDKDGNVYTWGYNGYGGLGLGDKTTRNLPVKVESLQGIKKIEAGANSTFAIDGNGKLHAAGYNNYGQLGDGTTSTRTSFVEVKLLDNVADVSTSYTSSTIVLKQDGTVWGFGNNKYNALTNVSGATPRQLQGPNGVLNNVTSINAGYYSGYAITSEEKILAWGLNNYYQLATGDKVNQSVPVYMKDKDGNDFTDAMLVSGGISNTEVAKNDGTVWSIGYNGYGELGDGSTSTKANLVSISNKYVKLAQREITLKLSNPDYQINPESVYGFNLLYDSVENKGFTYKVENPGVATVDENTGKVTAKGTGRTYVTISSKDSEDEARLVVNVIAEDKETVEKVESGHIHSLALKQDGTIWSWGDNSQGEMGNGTISSIKTLEPTQIEKGKYIEVREEETEEGSIQITTTEIEVTLDNIVDIAAGYYFNLVLDSDGYVYSFGYNGYGQLGDGKTQSVSIPTRIEGLTNIKKVYAYKNTSMAIDEEGNIYVWGDGYTKTPTKINFYNNKAVEINGKLILSEDGGVWYLSNSPSKIAGLSNIVDIASGDNYYAALDTKGQVWVWGYNGYGQLSQANRSNISTPTLVKVTKEVQDGKVEYETLTDIVELNAGNNSLQMVSKSGTLYAAGYSAYGQLGTGAYTNYVTIATKAANMNQTKFVDTNSYHSVASDRNGFVYTTGYNAYGELGDGGYTNRNKYSVIGDTYVNVGDNSISIEEGDTKQITATLDNKFNLIVDTVDDQNMTYKSLNTDIATIDGAGNITAKQMGTVEIIVTHTITNKTATIFVQVVPEEKTTVPKVEIGNTHMAALKADGTVWTWGSNTYGQLGTQNNISKTSPIKVPELEDVRDICVGYYDTIAVKQDGTVWAFGYNGYGQLGDGTGTNRNTPTQVIKSDGAPLTKIVKVSAGTYRTVALDEDGNVWTWGYKYSRTATKVATLENIIDISLNYAVNQSGEVYKITEPDTKLEVNNIIRVSEGSNHAMFLTKEGNAYALGTNSKGQLGIGTTTNASVPTLVQNPDGTQALDNIKEIKAGNEFSIAILKNGETYTWGDNANYKLGLADADYQVYPRKNEQTNPAISGDAGINNGAIIDEEGFVYTWGLGDNGILGNNLYETSIQPVLVGKEEVGLSENDIVLHKGEEYQLTVTNKTFNVLKEVEDRGEMNYQIGNSDIATIDDTGLVTGAKEGKTTVVVNKVGTNSISIANITVLPDGIDIEPMALTNMSHTVVLKANGTVWSYGINSSYQLGNGNTVSSDRPVQVKFPAGVIIKQIAVGNTHNLALDTNGNVWGWGANSNNALAGYTRSTPVQLGLSGIKKIAASNNQSMALTNDGYVYVWGLNTNGELGIGTYEKVERPTLVNYVSNVLDISLGKNHSMLLTTHGEVLTTGLNAYGQTAASESKTNTFEKIEVPATIGKISAGDNHSVLLSANGDVYTFGYNANGQLGNGTINNVNIPTKVNISNIMQISAGATHTTLLGENRKIYTTGSNSNGELGIGTNEDKLIFNEITAVEDMMSVDAGNTYNVAIKYDGDVYGWGDYYHGTQNIKTKTNSRIPVKIGNDSTYMEETEITVNVNGTKQIAISPRYTFNVFNEDEEESEFTFETINEDVATVNEKGIVTGVKTGVTWVKVTENETMQQNVVIVKVIEQGVKYAPQIAGGDGYAAVLKGDGSIWSFGYNSDGQLGNDTLAPINIPSQTNILATYKQVVAGEKFTLALRDDGTVWAWGDNSYGMLGQGNRVSAKKPVQVQVLNNIVSIAAGDNHAIALDNQGNVYTWGLNSKGQLGNGNTQTVSIPEKINAVENQIVAVAAGGDLSAFVDSTGAVYVFGDNSQEQIQKLTYNYDEFGQMILPATNLCVTEPIKLETIEDAVKVDILETGLVVLKIDGGVIKTSKYAAEADVQTTTIATENMVDISATNDSVVLLDRSGNTYTYGDNSKGQAGIGSNGGNVELSKINIADEKTYLSVGAGYKNNYVIDTEGFVYAAGDNEYGQLGNGTYDNSYTFTLVGDKKFEIVPSARIMQQPEEETVTIKTNLFNVFNHTERKLIDYTWESSNSDVVSVDNGVLVAEDMGEATITATDKIIGEKATALRVVQPLDEQRIQTISVNGVEAEVSGENKYEVSVEKNPDGTGTLKIVTKDATDQISIDNGVSYVTASLTQDIELDTNPKVVKIKVKASNGRTVDYVLTINVLSNDASLKELTVNNVLATPITSTEYEIIVKNNVVKPEVHAVANSSSATISIDSSIAEKSQTTKTIDMQNVIKKTIPIQVTAENGDKVTYELTIYQEDALTELESVMVNGSEAIKLNNNNYKAVIPKDEISAEIVAKSLYPKANIEINGLGQEVNITTKTVATIGNETIVKIYVRAGEGEAEREREYTLTLVKEGTEDLQGLFAVTVNGVEIKPVGKIYDAYIGANTDSVEVTAVTISDKDLVQIGDNEKCVHTSTVTLDSSQDTNTYTITVTDPEDETIQKQYTLNIKKPSADNSLKSITVGNEEFSETAVRVEGTNTFKVSVSDKYTKADVIAVAGYEQAQVSINYEEYEKGLSTREVEIGDTEPTKVEIMVKALNGNEQTYTLEIYKKNSNNNLQKVLVDGEEAQISQIAENIYEYTLDKIVDKLTIGAIAEDSSAFVGINTYEQEKGATYREVEMIGKQIIVYIPVTAEDGTTKEYQLIVNALPDNVNLLSVKVNGKEANAVPINKYEARVNKNDQSFELYVIPEDSKAKVQIGTNQEVVGTSSAVITKDAEEVTVNIKVTAQDGTQEDYVLTVSNQSDDCELAILRVDNKIIRAEDDGKYYVDKKYLTEEIKVQAIANNNYATVSINGTTPTLEEQTSIVTMPDEENTVRIMITAEDGTQKEYILIVNKLSNEVGISAYVGISENGVIEYKEVEINENGQTIVKIGNQELTNVKVIAKDELAKVSIQSELPQEKEMEKEIATIEDETKVNIQVTAQDGTIGNYEITLTRASKNNNLLELKADGVDSSDILKTSDNEYLMKIPDTMDELNLTAIAENEYATVKIADGEYSTDSNSKTEKITVNEEITEIAVYVKAENGDEKEYKVTIQKVTDLGLDSVKVDGEECIQEDGNYVAFINRGTQEVALNIKPNNPIALLSTKLQDDEDFGEAVAQETHIRQVNISSDETTVLIRVQDPKDLSRTREYTVVIKCKSSDASLEMIQIDGKEPIITEDGYYVATSTNAIDSKVFVKATNKYANIKIADEDEEQGQSTKSITLSDGKITTFVVTITSQDGTSQNTFNVTIERKSQDTSCEILINNEKADEIDNETNTYTKYVNRDLEEATIMVTTTSDVATVEMAGESATQTLTKVISIASETTNMEVIVTAESGETKTYHVNIVKKSTDNTIATVKVDNKIVEPDEEGNYVATVYDKGLDVQDVLVQVVANESHAKVQIGDGTEWSIGERTSTVSFKNGNRTMTLNINVQSQDETTEKLTKTLTINLVSNDVTIKSVKNGDQIVTEYDQATHTYYEFLDREVEQLTLVIEANNNYTTLTSGEMEGTGIITLNNVSIQDAEEMTITFKAIAETGNEQEYTIKLLRKSDNANAAHIYVDGVDIIDSFEDVESVPTAIVSISKNKNSSQIKVIPENSYASIKIGDFGSKVGETQNTVSLDTDLGTITVPIVITSQDGKVVKTYNIMFVRLSNDTKIQWLEVNGKHVIENDEGNYEITVKASEEVANVKITLSNILAKVTMGGEEKQGHLEENVILQKTGDMVKTITVTAVDGTVKTHTLTIHKKVNDLGLDKIYLDNRLATKVDETTFEIDVEKGMTLADIRAVASNSEEYVSISGNTSTKAENIYTDCSVIDKVVKIKVSAMFDGELDEEKEYTLILKEIEESDVLEDLNVIIKVDDEEIIPDANGNYVKFVGNDKDNVALWAGVTSETSKVKITDKNGETQYENPSSQKNISLQDMITEVTVTVQNGALQEKEYTVKIQKLSAITGKVITQATDQENQTAEITIYNSADTRDENDIDDPREEIQKIIINPDGTYRFNLQPGEYDMVIRKTSYLEYRLTNIVIGDGETAKIADISIYAGDVVETGEIEIDDLVAIADNYGLADEQEENKDRQKYDLNEDGIVDKLDRDILKANYGKLNEVVQWVNPNAIAKARIMTIEEPKEEQTQDFILPIKCDYTITSEYGTRTHPITGETKKHTGIDLGVEHHTEVLAVADGEITFAGVQNGFGNCIEIKHIVNGETIYSFYAHLSRIDVKTGEKVAQGQVIGLEGGDPNTDPNPGSSTGHHLHFEMRNASGYGNDVDPREYIEF